MASRILNREGRFNIGRAKRRTLLHDPYHHLLSVSWARFLGLYVGTFFTLNAMFAMVYFALGPDALEGVSGDLTQRFLESFFFSVQTFATIGYGKIGPKGLVANLVVTFEAMSGLLSIAVGTGLMFARFSRPMAKIIFSKKAIVQNIDGVPSFMLRIANERKNHVLEAQVDVVITVQETTREGETYRNFYDLKLERSHSPLFALTWTIVHPIDPTSPLYGKTAEALRAADAEILVTFQGVDETILNTIYSRISYTADDILWAHRFKDVIKRSPLGDVSLMMENFHSTVPL